VIVLHNSARGKQLTAGRSGNPTRIVILPVLRNEGSDQRESKGHSLRSLPFLIANLELEFLLTPIRITELRFPNRKYSQLSCPERRRARPEARRVHSPGSTRSHSSNRNSRFTEKQLSHTKQARKQNSNRNKIAFSTSSVSHAFYRERSVSEPLSCAPNLAIIDFPVRGHL
jgi:hypothetical protein